MRTLITAIKELSAEQLNMASKMIAAGKVKHGSDFVIVLLNRDASEAIARITAALDVRTQTFCTKLDSLKSWMLDGQASLAILNAPTLKDTLEFADNVIAFNAADPIVLEAKRINKPVWIVENP